jgi:hypothetical protein
MQRRSSTSSALSDGARDAIAMVQAAYGARSARSSRTSVSTVTSVVTNLTGVSEDHACPVCQGDGCVWGMLPCSHVMCRDCRTQLFQNAESMTGHSSSSRCPLCRAPHYNRVINHRPRTTGTQPSVPVTPMTPTTATVGRLATLVAEQLAIEGLEAELQTAFPGRAPQARPGYEVYYDQVTRSYRRR